MFKDISIKFLGKNFIPHCAPSLLLGTMINFNLHWLRMLPHKLYIIWQIVFWEKIFVKYQKNFNNSYFISPLKGNLPFISTHFKAVKPRMLCSYFNWNRLSSSEDENVKKLTLTKTKTDTWQSLIKKARKIWTNGMMKNVKFIFVNTLWIKDSVMTFKLTFQKIHLITWQKLKPSIDYCQCKLININGGSDQ